MTTTTPGREPRTIVEIVQPRCVNTFGTSPCTATGTKCYNTWSTCSDKPNYDGTGSISWRLVGDTVKDDLIGDFSDPDNIKTNGIPCVRSVSTAGNKINPGANRDGESPFGVTAKVNVGVSDIPWDDHVGDPYLTSRSWYQAGRALETRGGFWRLFNARNDFLNDMTINVYDGYDGQALAAMRKRTYTLENINGPSFDGRATITGVDPLKAVSDKKVQYPPASDLELAEDISAGDTSFQVFGSEDDLTLALGSDSATSIKVGDEFITYTGYTDDGDNFYTLTGCTRGVFGTSADTHSDGDRVQRIARFYRVKPWELLEDLLTFNDTLPAAYIPTTDWAAECDQYIPTYRFSRILHDPTGIRALAGELCQQALFYVWWAEYDQEVKLLTVRPPSDPVATLTDDNHIQDGIEVKADHEQRITRVVVYYGERDPLGGDDAENFARKYVTIDTDTEGAGVSPVIKEIYARWIDTRSQAVQLAVKLLIRYKATPRFVQVTIDAKDREIGVGDLADVYSRYFLTSEGDLDTKRWQVISAKEMTAGHSYVLDMQTYTYVGRFAVYMDVGSPDYSAATDEQKANGAWYADASGLVDGDEGYQYQ